MTESSFNPETSSISPSPEKSNTREVRIPPEAQEPLLIALRSYLWNETRQEMRGGYDEEGIASNDEIRGVYKDLVKSRGEEGGNPIFDWLYTGILSEVPLNLREEYKQNSEDPNLGKMVVYLEEREKQRQNSPK